VKFPLSWVREFTAVPQNISHHDLENAFVRVGFEVESIEEQGADLTGPLVVGQVLEIEQLEGHKKPIRYVALDCAEGSTRYVICGATNFSVGDLVVVALPGAVLPGDFAISARETYGKTSNGMICSARELGISDEHSGIIVLAPDQAKVGQDAISLLEIRDTIVDIAVNPDRGYAMSIRGVARELAASLNLDFTDPIAQVDLKKFDSGTDTTKIIIGDKTSASVAYLRTVDNFNASAPVPLWMSRRIEKCGMRSISLAVDITNYVMLELGQPLHAFDRACISGDLQIRRAGSEKKFTTLDGVERELHPDDLVVADSKNSLALAGTMGGQSSEVTSSTTSIALEAVRFSPIDIAKNSRRHKLSSEASRRLERSVDPILAEIAGARGIDLMMQLGQAIYIGTSCDGVPVFPEAVLLDPNFVSRYLGVEIPLETIQAKLEVVGCAVEVLTGDQWRVTPPTWRADLLAAPDFVEEVARMVGFDAIPSTLPTGKFGAALTNIQKRKRAIAQLLADKGLTEVYNYPFVSPTFVSSLGFTGERASGYLLANPMSEEFPMLRPHLLPGLLLTAVRNLGRGAKDVAIFEIGTLFKKSQELSETSAIPTDKRPSDSQLEEIYKSVPPQPLMVAGVLAGNLIPTGWKSSATVADWNDAIGLAAAIVEATGNQFSVAPSDFAPWHPGRCAEIIVDGRAVSHAGELHPRVCAELGLPARSVAFAVILSALPYQSAKAAPQIWTMPAAVQDIALIVPEGVPAAQIEHALRLGAGELLESITLFDRYEKVAPGSISLAFTLVFRASDRTLTADEVSGYRLAAAQKAADMYGATIRS